MLRFFGDRLASFEADDESDREGIVAGWIAQQSTSWGTSAIVLGMTFGAMVLFALSRA